MPGFAYAVVRKFQSVQGGLEMFDHEHDRFLYEKDSFLHFGCINPFCGHGDPALPNHYKIPMEIPAMSIQVIEHKERKLTIEATIKRDAGEFKCGQKVTLVADDNLESCKQEFDRVFNSS